jgi:hypothetical protein
MTCKESKFGGCECKRDFKRGSNFHTTTGLVGKEKPPQLMVFLGDFSPKKSAISHCGNRRFFLLFVIRSRTQI